jgi:hypothetical protein
MKTLNQFVFLALVICFLPAIFSGLKLSAQTWTQLSPVGGPPAGRSLFASAYNPNNNRMIVFGGDLNNLVSVPPLANDVWVLTNADGTTGTPGWQQLSPTGTAPQARAIVTSVYDTNNNRLIVFGGDPTVGNCYNDLNDVWVLTNADGSVSPSGWVKLNPGGSLPSGRARNSMIYDQANNRVGIYGGNQECQPAVYDVWTLTNANGLGGTPGWMQLSPSGTAPVSGVSAYDAANNQLIQFGGNLSGVATNDVWLLSHPNGIGGTPVWTRETPTGTSPIRSDEVSAYDPVSNTLIVFGGITASQTNDVWQLANANNIGGTPAWTRVTTSGSAPPPCVDAGGFYNSVTHRLVIFGGVTCNPSCNVDNHVWVLTFGAVQPPALVKTSVSGSPVVVWQTSATGYSLQMNTIDSCIIE